MVTPIKMYLFGLGAVCVEHLKMLEPIEIDGMFQHHPHITQRVSRRVFKYFKSSGKCDTKKCARELGIQQAAAPRLSKSMNSRSGRFGDIGVHSKAITELFYYTFLTSVDEVKLRRLKRRAENEK